MVKEKKGLSAIFGEGIENIMDEIDGVLDSKEPSTNIEIKNIISNPYQPRKQFDNSKLKELSESIKQHEVFTPIIVKKGPTGKYYLIAGERRTRASKIAGLKTIPAIIKDITDNEMQEISLIENIQREDLNPIEEALSYKSIMEKQTLTQEQLSEKIGKSRSHIANVIRSLSLDEKIIKYVTSGKLTFGHVKPLITIDKNLALKISLRTFEEKLTVREVEAIVQGYRLKNFKKESKLVINKYRYAEDLFRNKIKSKVTIKQGKIIIPFKNDNSLNRILERLDLLEDE